MKWKQLTQEVSGKVQDVVSTIFTFEGKQNEITNIDTSCGCVNNIFDYPFLKVDLKLPKKHPAIEESVFYVDKNIYITYIDGTTNTLTIKATIYE